MTDNGPRRRDDRGESHDERMDRNWNELLQELRVSQTGVQILAGFLLTLPFQQRFTQLGATTRTLYLVTVVVACVSTLLLVTPVVLHRALFRRHAKDTLVRAADRLARAGLGALGVTVSGVVTLVFTVVLGGWSGAVAGLLLLLALGASWWLLPRRLRART
ncbi:DUF6328 family protein [Angustibacter sp. Root456]|uniref:DUF6328 family protein n=1 Tax=Angustibacter sp. Root456 TaxID=1736539 RepID=UPI0006FBE829|nr:DUF6328 family protein [Angustibacter sp. Root456]KQX69668.1 sodium:proton antiporter [Angustibacter sp. Root456]